LNVPYRYYSSSACGCYLMKIEVALVVAYCRNREMGAELVGWAGQVRWWGISFGKR